MCTRNLFSIVMFFLLYSISLAQPEIIIDRVDMGQYPESLTARIWIKDADGNFLHEMDEAVITVTENGTARELAGQISCPEKKPKPISALIVLDVSASMNDTLGNGLTSKIILAKSAISSWIDNMVMEGSETAIQTFSEQNYIISNFTSDKDELKASLDNILMKKGTYYNIAFWGRNGAFDMVYTGRRKKVIIFFTDGHPNHGHSVSSLKVRDKATENNQDPVTIYCVAIDSVINNHNAKRLLENIALSTGGTLSMMSREQANPDSALKEIFRHINHEATGNFPCELEWLSGAPCDTVKEITIRVEVESLDLVAESSFTLKLPDTGMPEMQFEPNSVEFDIDAEDSGPYAKEVEISVPGKEVTVGSIDINTRPKNSQDMFSVDKESFLLSPGEPVTLTITYDPTDNLYRYAGFDLIDQDGCLIKTLHATGQARVKLNETTLRVVSPNGGEYLSNCQDTIIKWSGILPDDRVKLEYSSDGGGSWELISEYATGLQHRWPPPGFDSDIYLVRVTHVRDSVVSLKHRGKVNVANFKQDNSVVVTGWDAGTTLWDPSYGHKLRELDYGKNIIAADFTYNNLMYTASADGDIFVYDDMYSLIQTIETGGAISYIETAKRLDENNKLALAVSYYDRDYVDIYYMESGQKMMSLPSQDCGGILQVRMMDLPGEEMEYRVAAIRQSDKNVDVWHISGAEYNTICERFSGARGGGTVSLMFTTSPDTLVTGHANGEIIVWYLAEEPDSKEVMTDHFANVNNLQLAAAYGRWFVSASSDSTLSVYKDDGGLGLLKQFRGHSDVVNYAGYSKSDSNYVISASDDSTARIWDVYSYFIQQDVSDNVFSVSTPDIDIKPVKFLSVTKGDFDEQTVEAQICNNSPFSVPVWDYLITGGNSDEFFLMGTPERGTVIGANSCMDVAFEFWPEDFGTRTADLELYVGDEDYACLYSSTITGLSYEAEIMISDSVDFGSQVVNLEEQCADTLNITVLNVTESPVEFDAPYLAIQNENFKMLDTEAFTVGSGETYNIAAEFRPTSVGYHTGIVAINSSAVQNTGYVYLFGEAEPALAEINSPELMDMDTIYCREPADTILIIRNPAIGKCDTTLVIDTIEVVDSQVTENDFYQPTMPDGSPINYPLIVPPGQEIQILVTANTESKGMRQANMHIYSNAYFGEPYVSSCVLNAYVECNSTVVIMAPHLRGKNGQILDVPISIFEKDELFIDGVEFISTNLEFNATMLVPRDYAHYVQELRCKVSIDDMRVTRQTEVGDVLEVIPMRVTLGDNDSTDLALIDARSVSGNLIVYSVDGSFVNTGLCMEGDSVRLLLPDVNALAPLSPNPINESTEIIFEIVNDGKYRLILTDMMGNERVQLLNTMLCKGEYSLALNPDILPSGTYFLILYGPQRTWSRKLEVLR